MNDALHENENTLNEILPGYPATGHTGKDIDLSLLEDSLHLTPWQRLIENGRALALVRMLEQARVREDGRP